jgi:hypothetical protein
VTFINPYTSSQMAAKALIDLNDGLTRLQNMEGERLDRVRHKLYVYSLTLPAQKAKVVQMVLCNINVFKKRAVTQHRSQHLLSDHAFVRVLERGMGVSIVDVKNQALDIIRKRNMIPRYSYDGKVITTVYPQEWRESSST